MGELAQKLIPGEVYEAYRPILNPNEFIDGMRDSKEGVIHRAGMGADYDRGFAAQKELEAIQEKRREYNR